MTVPAPHWWIPAPHFYRALRLQCHTGGFQRPIFIEHYDSSAKLVDSSAPFLSSIMVPAPSWWIPAPHFYRALRFQRQTGGFQRPIFIEHYGSNATLVDSSAPFLSSITAPAPHWWIPAPHFYRALRFQRHTGGFQRPIFIEQYGSSATLVDSSAPCLCSITVPAPIWWITAAFVIEHYGSSATLVDSSAPCYATLQFQRHTGGFQRPIFIEHYGSSATLVDSSATLVLNKIALAS